MELKEMKEMKTVGELRVRARLNPAASGAVDRIKNAAAKLIDEIAAAGHGNPGGYRLRALGMTAAEEAAMWGVKAAAAPGAEHIPNA